jgi:hypothetical protein
MELASHLVQNVVTLRCGRLALAGQQPSGTDARAAMPASIWYCRSNTLSMV